MKHLRLVSFLFAIAMLLVPLKMEAATDGKDTVKAEINGLRLTFDSQSGSIVEMSPTDAPAIIKTSIEDSSLIDVAYPVEGFDPLRLAARYSRGARIIKSANGVDVYYDSLGPSRDFFTINGKVSAIVHLKAAADGKSIVMSCEVHNQTDRPVPQVLFPDFMGIVPFDGEDAMELRNTGFAYMPFRQLKWPVTDVQYLSSPDTKIHTPGAYGSQMTGRWFNLGGYSGGFCLFPKSWGFDPQIPVMVRLYETLNTLRIACLNNGVNIKPGEKWQSGEFVLTGHKYGWANGIGPYREWVKQHIDRKYPVPERVRKGMGFRTIWMCQNQPSDPRDVVWRFKDVPSAAKESKEHGLDEMVLWAWHRGFVTPIPPPYPHLGTEQELIDAVSESRKLGVNVVPFVSLLQFDRATAPKYGKEVRGTDGWSYHTELVPRDNPGYAVNFACVRADITNQKWQDDVVASLTSLMDKGMPSIGWDQFILEPERPNICDLTLRIRAEAVKRDPEATFSGEDWTTKEIGASYLDYTWNWERNLDCRAFTSAFPSPRLNFNINRSAEEVKVCFGDNVYMNIFTTKLGSINGSDKISNNPELSKALKQCAKLREQFLPYFVDGALIGDCILAKPCPDTRVNAYVLPDRVLAIVYNYTDKRRLDLTFELKPWVKSPSGKYTVKRYDIDGNLKATVELGGTVLKEKTPKIDHQDIVLYEIIAR